MSIFSGLKNLRTVASRLGSGKWKRAGAMIKDYGIREFSRRVLSKMRGDGLVVISADGYTLTNEAFLAKDASLTPFRTENMVSFRVGPGGDNIAKLEILTSNPNHDSEARLRLEVFDGGERIVYVNSEEVADQDYTTFFFQPVGGLLHRPVDFVITSLSDGCGILVDRKRSQSGFVLQGGGRIACRLYMRATAIGYETWLENNILGDDELAAQRAVTFDRTPLFSIAVPIYNTKEDILRDMIDSVRAQTYGNWELCLADGSTDRIDRSKIAASYDDSRIHYQRLDKNEGISGNTNAAIAMASGDFVCFLDHDDTLAPQALFENAACINADPDIEFIYSDEDKIDEKGEQRFDPFFKPDYSPNLLLAFNYITHFSVIKKALLDEIGLLRQEYDGAQDYDLILRATERAKKVAHIPDVLYHWRVTAASTAMDWKAKSYTIEAGQSAIEDALRRRGVDAMVLPHRMPNSFTVIYPLPDPAPLISIIIPSHNEPDTLKKCIDSITRRCRYPNVEILIVENNSTDPKTFKYYDTLKDDPRIRILTWNHPFNYAAINNWAVGEANGDVLVFLNNDVEVITPDWLEQMASLALRPDVGAVGAKLYYPDRTIQHGGIIIRIGGIAGHSHKCVSYATPGYYGRMVTVHDLSAVTAACIMMRREVFESVGGFDEEFVLAFNDVDLCLKIREQGLSILFTPMAELYHYESKTRGYEITQEQRDRFVREQVAWLRKWMRKYPGDPFYNPNLTYQYEQFQIDGGKTGSSLRAVTRPYDALIRDETPSE